MDQSLFRESGFGCGHGIAQREMDLGSVLPHSVLRDLQVVFGPKRAMDSAGSRVHGSSY